MPNNTKARSEFLNSLAAEIAAREHVDVTQVMDSRAYINEIVERGECHRETARAVWARYCRRARYKLVVSWGGAGRGQGRKPTMPAPDAGDSADLQAVSTPKVNPAPKRVRKPTHRR